MSDGPVVPGEILVDGPPIEINEGRPVVRLPVVNTGDRPIQVGSHFHFAEANHALEFDRGAARGMHLAVPAGTSARFEPGAARHVDLVPFAGARFVAGFRGEVGGPLDRSGSGTGASAGGTGGPSGAPAGGAGGAGGGDGGAGGG